MIRLKTKKQNITHIKLEEQLYLPVKRHLLSEAFSIQKEQMQFYEYKIDIYCYSHAKEQTAAVELKVSDFNKAVKQALIYQLCSDLVFIAMPIFEANNCSKDLIKQYGIGIIGVDGKGSCTVIEDAVVSKFVRRNYKNILIAQMEETS